MQYIENIFTKIIKGEIPAEVINKNDEFLCIKDIKPAALKHYLIIPKRHFIDFDDFCAKADSALKCELFEFIKETLAKTNTKQYKLVTNNGAAAGQEVFHLHFHILSNEKTSEV